MARVLGSNDQSLLNWFNLNHMFFIIVLLQSFCSIHVLSVAVDSDVIKFLPGFNGPLPFHLETGYVGVGESEDVELFYYFVKSERNPEKDPLVLWLCGGPGCSGWSGFVYEIGPLRYDNYYKKDKNANGSFVPSLTSNPYSWTKISSVIFLDSPVGTGFSYGKTLLASQPGSSTHVHGMLQFLRKWLISHPEFISNPVYLSGDSYSGIPIPMLALQISNENKGNDSPPINLQGYTLGNPVTDPSEDKFIVPFAHGHALISDELFRSLEKNCGGQYNNIDPSNTRCLKDMEAFEKCVSGIDRLNILAPSCKIETLIHPDQLIRSLNENIEDPLYSEPHCRDRDHMLSHYWVNHPSVLRALGFREGSIEEWKRCDYDLPYHKEVHSTVEHHFNLSIKGYRSLIYSGDQDTRVPFLATQAWIRSLNFSIVDDWRPWIVQDQVAGYTRSYSGGMTYATVKGGGHTAPQTNPKECFAMFQRWVDYEPL